jgi:conjugal transfer mating pair stabilization protein TraN
MDESYLQNDGQKDADGNCLGTVYIFGGKPSRCRPPGLTVGEINDCCAPGGQIMNEDTGSSINTAISAVSTLYDIGTIAYVGSQMAVGNALISTLYSAEGVVSATVETASIVGSGVTTTTYTGAMAQAITGMQGTVQGAAAAGSTATSGAVASSGISSYVSALLNPTTILIAAAMMVAMKVIMGGGCDQGDIQTTMARDSGLCHSVGDFCYKKWAMVGCVQQAKGYCCYNSKLARIIAEQGRPQLNVFGSDGGWGSANAPNCRGFTPEEFQALDFNRIDLTEYYAVVEKDMADKVKGAQQSLTNTVQQRVQQIQGK